MEVKFYDINYQTEIKGKHDYFRIVITCQEILPQGV